MYPKRPVCDTNVGSRVLTERGG
eukprot:COSAG01_NODE_69685_length_260_cov_1.608696_1_plen_22_part_01